MLRSDTDIAMALRRYRIAARLNQAEIARSLGVSQSRISRWESGQELPRARTLELLRALIWGRDDPVLEALKHQVRASDLPLVLVDARLDLLATSRFLRLAGGPLSQFGTVFERRFNPEISRLAAAFRAYADNGAVAARIVLPFAYKEQSWLCTARLTYCPIGPRLYGMGEMSFLRAGKSNEGEARVTAIVDERTQ